MSSIKGFIVVVMSLSVFGGSPAWAQRSGDQGYGVMIGNPSGFSGKYWLDDMMAIDGAIGVARGEFDIHIDLLWHSFDWLKSGSPSEKGPKGAVARGELPLYFGVGPRLLFEEDKEFGIRLPVGLSYLPKGKEWEIFGEVAPVIRVTQDFGFNGDFAVGFRYYFKTIRPLESQ